jgi:osmotically-inducible protein OsmY
MKADLEIPDNQITTKVEEGFVTIEGIVDQDSQKKAAESCVSKIKGVRGVANKIGVDSAALRTDG